MDTMQHESQSAAMVTRDAEPKIYQTPTLVLLGSLRSQTEATYLAFAPDGPFIS